MKHRFQVGDQVRIQRAYWEKLAKDKGAIKLYVNNGPDYIYAVSEVHQDGSVVISDYGDDWNHPERYLELADTDTDEDIAVLTLSDVL